MNDADHALLGRTVGGRFRLTAFLGEGSMASVYRGEQDGDPREVAVKIMHPPLLADATFAKRFTREAKAAARIEHRNSVRIIEQGADGDLLYLAMELLVGQDLFDLLARERRLPVARAVRIVEQICAAVSAAHAHGIVHRDLKPENVMILADPSVPGGDLVKVLDFGIAKILEREAGTSFGADGPPSSEPIESAPPSSALTRVGGIVGTPEYMSPEQALGLPVDGRADVYSCGALLFLMVTGHQPFTGKHPLEVIMAVADKPPPAPSIYLPDIDPALEGIILKALAKAPAARQQSADELASELRACLADQARTPVPSSGAASGAPVSDANKALPGVPTEVTIHPSNPRSDPPPPDTLRSPAQSQEPAATATPMVRVVETPPPAPDSSPEVESGAETRRRGAVLVPAQTAAPFSLGTIFVIVAAVAVAIWLARHFGLG